MQALTLTRRGFAIAAAAAALPSGKARAQTPGKIVMAAWGGGVGDAWREVFATPFQAQSKTTVSINEVIDPSAQIRAQAGAPQYNAAIATYVDAVNLYKAGLIETFAPDEFPRIGTIPPQYRLTAPDGRLLGMPAYFMYYGIAVRTNSVRTGEIASWKDLANPRWKGRLAVTGPLYGSTYDLTMCAYAAGGDERNIDVGLPLYKGIVANAMTVYSTMTQMNQLLTRDEIVAGPYYSARIWQMKRNGITDIDMVIPREGPLMLPYMVVVPKGAPDLAAARSWLNFISMPEPQHRITDVSGYMPLPDDAQLSAEQETKLGMSLQTLRTRLVKPDWFTIANDQQRRADLVEQITAQAK